MAKKSTPKPVTPATLDSKEAIRVLRILRDKGNPLLSKRPLEKNGAETWASMGREVLIKAFGSDSDRVREFADIATYRVAKEDSPAGWEQDRIETVQDQLAIVESCIEQMELLGGEAARAAATSHGDRIFIGHGRDSAWREVKDFVVDRLHLDYEEFNREPTAGIHTAERLQKMLDESAFALIVATGEDEHVDGKQHARKNVVHEIGLFQGRLGFRRAIVLLEDGCEEFSNIEGVTQIRFKKGQIRATTEEIRRTLEREGLL